jgi:hypothetical protein
MMTPCIVLTDFTTDEIDFGDDYCTPGVVEEPDSTTYYAAPLREVIAAMPEGYDLTTHRDVLAGVVRRIARTYH